MVDVVQWLERQVVALEVKGSNPFTHPTKRAKRPPSGGRFFRNFGATWFGGSLLGRSQAVRHETLTLACAGSTPAAPAMFDPLAQLAEHLTFNQGVPRSSRGWITNYGPLVKRASHRPFTAVTGVRFPYGSPIPGTIAQLGEHLPYKQGVTGSSPVSPTNYINAAW